MPFFVAGLPRSRTAWMANFLTYDGHFCHHEGWARCRTMEEYRAFLGDDGDSGTGMQFININTAFPGSKVLIIERPLKEVAASIESVFGECNRDRLNVFDDSMKKVDGLRLPFAKLNESLPMVWDYLIGTTYDERRGKMLASLNVQVNDVFDFDMDTARTFLNAA